MSDYLRKPDWLKIQLNNSVNTASIRRHLRKDKLHSICEEARCPNLHECWTQHRTATFMILGDTCTRRCRFCAVKTGLPAAPDKMEPERVAHAVEKLGIEHAVITMVNRDDLSDGGASYLAQTGRSIHRRLPDVRVEYLSSDLMGNPQSIALLTESSPEILSHNLETIRRLTPLVRSRSDYDRSLNFLATARKLDAHLVLKSSLMLGLGETHEELVEALKDLRAVGCQMVNLGQYLQPTRQHLPVERYWRPEEFLGLKNEAQEMGFAHVEAGPLVRSSYHAGDQLKKAYKNESL